MCSRPDAILLCGGAGLRLREITGNVPKAMARVGGRPFLELLLRQLRRHRFERVILAVGYQQELIRLHFGASAFGLHLAYSDESSPLGTGGAVRHAAPFIESDTALIMNGDSYTDADLQGFLIHHVRSKADASIVVVPADERTDCGSVLVDGRGKLARFEEKQNRVRTPYLNAGIYLVSRHILSDIPPGVPVSLEDDVFPRWLEQGKHIETFVCLSKCVDIGTPDRYRRAQETLSDIEVAASVPEQSSQL